SLGVAGVTHEPDHLPGLHMRAVRRRRRERREVRVIELVPLLVEEPEPVAADLVPADREDGSVGHSEERLAELAEDVVTVVIADVRARRAEGVDVRGRAVDGEDIVAGRELGLHLERSWLRPGGSLLRAEPRRVTGLRIPAR